MDPNNPISLLLPLGGIALILICVWLAGGARRAPLDAVLVRRRIEEDLLGFRIGAIAIAEDETAALVAGDNDDAVAVVFMVGDKAAVRRLGSGDVRKLTCQSTPIGLRLSIATGDFTRDRFELLVPKENMEMWAERLAKLVHTEAPKENAA